MKISKIIKLIVAVALVLLLGLFALVYSQQDKIAAYAISQLNESLIEPAEIDAVNLSVFSNFPGIAIKLQQVSLPGSFGLDLVYAEQMNVVIGLRGILSGKYKTRRIELSHAWINIHFDEAGEPNYNIFKETQNEENPAELNWQFNKITLEQVTIHYHDMKSGTEAKVTIPEGSLGGNISGNGWQLEHNLELIIEKLLYEKENYIENISFGLRGDLDFRSDGNILDIKSMVLRSNKSELSASGDIAFFEKEQGYKIQFDGKDLDIGDLVALLPAQYSKLLANWESDGNLKASGTYTGKMNAIVQPEFLLNFELQKGVLRHPDLKNAISDVILLGNIKIPSGQGLKNASINFPTISLKAGRDPINGSLEIKNFESPVLKTAWNGSINLEAWVAFIQSPQISKPAGIIKINNFSFDGALDNLVAPEKPFNAKVAGIMELDNISLEWDKKPLLVSRAIIKLSNDRINLSEARFEGFGIKSAMDANAVDIWPFLLGKSRVMPIIISGNMQAEYLNLDKLLADLPTTNSDNEVSSGAGNKPLLTDLMKGAFQVSITNFTWQEVKTSDWKGKLEFSPVRITLTETSCKGMEGDFRMAGYITFPDKIRLMLAIEAANVNATELFRQFDNFSQTSVTDKNVSGMLSGRIYVDVHWDANGNFMSNDLEVLADIGIQKGRLKNVKMFESFAGFARLDDLKNIEIVNMRNVFEFSNLTFRIPVMFIQNNALNITMSGEHFYDHRIDYQLAVNASQIALNRMNPFRNAGQTLPAGNGGLILFYRIFGSTADFKHQADRSFVQTKFEQTNIQRIRLESRIQTIFEQQKLGSPLQNTTIVPKIDNFDFLLEQTSGKDDLEYIDFDE